MMQAEQWDVLQERGDRLYRDHRRFIVESTLVAVGITAAAMTFHLDGRVPEAVACMVLQLWTVRVVREIGERFSRRWAALRADIEQGRV